MFKNRSLQVRVVKSPKTPAETDVAESRYSKEDIKEMLFYGAVTVAGIALSVALSSAIEKIAVHTVTTKIK